MSRFKQNYNAYVLESVSKYAKSYSYRLTLKLAGGGFVEHSFGFFSLKFLPLDQLPNASAQLFLDNEDIFLH